MATGIQRIHDMDIWKTKVECQKNHHQDYIKFQSFQQKDLPGRLSHDEDLFKAITHLGILTVKIKVKKLLENNNNTCQIFRGLHGSGRITEFISQNRETEDGGVYQEVIVQTSHHVVGPETEVDIVECEMFFENSEKASKSFCSKKIIKSDERRDVCLVAFTINDVSLIKKLKKSFQKFNKLSTKLHKKYSYVQDCDKLCVLVSHPHGCYKSISFGTWLRNREGYYNYTARSCSSSSGGPLFLLGAISSNLIHRGYDGTGANCSCLEDDAARDVLTLPDNQSDFITKL